MAGYEIDIFNIRETQDERTRRKLARYSRRQARLMSRKKRIDALFNV